MLITIQQSDLYPLLIFFNTPATYFQKYFRTEFRLSLMSGSREICISPGKLFRFQTQFFY